MFRNKYFQKFLIVSFLIFSSVSFAVRPAHAGLKEWLYEKSEALIPELDITKTVQSILIESTTGFIASAVLDRNLDEVSNCLLVSQDIYMMADGDYTLVNPLPTSPVISLAAAAGDPQKEELINAAWAEVSTYDLSVCDFDGTHVFGQSGVAYRGSGSMLAIASTLRDATANEPLPVNMAYFFKDYARRIPIIKNTAYAQTDYNIIGEEAIYSLWVLSRNISLGMMSLVLLVIGVMIMTRKKINPQAVVTVQNALPRIAVGIALIFFSFPIGALFASLLMPLANSALSLPGTLVSTLTMPNVTVGNPGNLNTLLLVIFTILWGIVQAGVGLLSTILCIVVLLVSLIVLIIVYIRALIIYIKVLFNIVIAPVQFTIGVLPGKESSTMDWFKSMAADVLSAPAMFLMVAVAWFFADVGLGGYLSNPVGLPDDFGAGVSLVFTALFTPIIMMFCLMTALKMPGKVQKIIMGDKRK